MDHSLPGSFAHGILQARILEWVAISSSRGSSQPRDQTQISCIAGRFFTFWATREAHTNLHQFCLCLGREPGFRWGASQRPVGSVLPGKIQFLTLSLQAPCRPPRFPPTHRALGGSVWGGWSQGEQPQSDFLHKSERLERRLSIWIERAGGGSGGCVHVGCGRHIIQVRPSLFPSLTLSPALSPPWPPSGALLPGPGPQTGRRAGKAAGLPRGPVLYSRRWGGSAMGQRRASGSACTKITGFPTLVKVSHWRVVLWSLHDSRVTRLTHAADGQREHLFLACSPAITGHSLLAPPAQGGAGGPGIWIHRVQGDGEGRGRKRCCQPSFTEVSVASLAIEIKVHLNSLGCSWLVQKHSKKQLESSTWRLPWWFSSGEFTWQCRGRGPVQCLVRDLRPHTPQAPKAVHHNYWILCA